MMSYYEWYLFTPVMSYLILFRIEELGMGHLKKFMATQDTKKMFKVHKQLTITDI